MAVPTLTSNSPVAGSIAWTAFKIRFESVVYNVPAGSSAQRFVWWKYNDGAPTITGGAEAPDDLTPDDLMLFMNKDGIPFNLQSAQVVDGSLIVDGSILAPSLAVGIIDSSHIITDGLDAAVIKFGTMSGDRLESTAIDGMTITGALFRTAATGARVEINVMGLLQYDATNTLVSRIGTSGDNFFSGIVDAKSIMVRDGLELFGQNNMFGSNAKVTLQTGQAGSQSAPSMATSYDTKELPDQFTYGYWYLRGYWESSDGALQGGICNEYGGNGYLLGPNGKKFVLGNETNGWRSNRPDGTVNYRYMRPSGYVRFTSAGGSNPKVVFLCGLVPEGLPLNEYERPTLVIADDTPMNVDGTARPTILLEKQIGAFNWFRSYALGRVIAPIGGPTVGVEQLFAFANHNYYEGSVDELQLSLQQINGAGNDVVDNFYPGPLDFAPYRVHTSERVKAIHYGSLYGMRITPTNQDGVLGNHWVIQTTHQNIVLKGDLSIRRTEWEWPVIPGSHSVSFAAGDIGTAQCSAMGLINDSANLEPDNQQRINWYSNWTWSGGSTADKRIWAQFAWRGHSSKAPEWLTPPSAMSEPFVPAKRSRVRVNIPALPPPEAGVGAARDINKDVYGWVLYLGQSTNQPANAAMFRHNSLSPAGDPTSVTSAILSASPTLSGSNPLTVTQGFPSLSPAKIVSSAASGGVPLLSIDGDGNIVAKSINVKRITATSSSAGNTNYNTMLESGWYVMDSTATNGPGAGATSYLEVRSYAGTYIKQTATHVVNGYQWTRYMKAGVWGAWDGNGFSVLSWQKAATNSDGTLLITSGNKCTLYVEAASTVALVPGDILFTVRTEHRPLKRVMFGINAAGAYHPAYVNTVGQTIFLGGALASGVQILGSVTYDLQYPGGT